MSTVEHRVGTVVVHVRDDLLAQDDPLSTQDWSQRHTYGDPPWGDTFADLNRRISIETHHSGLILGDQRDHDRLPHLLAYLGVGDQREYEARRLRSTQPLLDGYLVGLRFDNAPGQPQPHSVAEVITAFVAAELARSDEIESELVEIHGGSPPDHAVLRMVDYPHFDNGLMTVGYGLQFERGGALRVWSRPNHHHK
jgi:hypothetical protein